MNVFWAVEHSDQYMITYSSSLHDKILPVQLTRITFIMIIERNQICSYTDKKVDYRK